MIPPNITQVVETLSQKFPGLEFDVIRKELHYPAYIIEVWSYDLPRRLEFALDPKATIASVREEVMKQLTNLHRRHRSAQQHG